MSRKLIAILRGITPDESEAVAEVLIDKGINWIEVPLNSPDVLVSIERIAKKVGDHAHIGAGTVTEVDEVGSILNAGGTYIVSPNCDTAVIKQTKSLGMGSYPGVFTPSECFTALKAGADALKLFPVSMMGTSGVEAVRSVLPADTALYAVGGVSAENLGGWREYGIDGYGIGSALYKPGKSLADIAESAQRFVEAYDQSL